MTACDTSTRAEPFTTDYLLRLYTAAPGAFWRHDVDVSLEAAAKMARFAQLAGVHATFYVMSRAEFYNPFSPAGARAISAIHNAGHRLGLHCDARFTGGTVSAVRDQQRLLTVGYPGLFSPDAVSFHMPSPLVLWRDFDEFDSAYAARWQDHYLSDARREWDDDKQARVGNDMQIALHPEHWFSC